MLRSAWTAGLIGAVLSLLPFGIFAFPVAGFLSVLFYRRRTWGAEPSSRSGFRLGALTGALGFPVFTVLKTILIVAAHQTGEMRKQMLDQIQAAYSRNPDPQARQMLDYFMTPQGLTIVMVLGLVFACVLVILFAGAGGAISASLLRRKGPQG